MRILDRLTKRPEVYAAVDMGSHAIKGAVFEVPEPGKSPRVIKKIISKFPQSLRQEKSGHRLHEFLSSLVKSPERVPSKIIIAIGPNAGEYMLTSWRAAKPQIASVGDLRKQFQNLFEVNRNPERSLVAYPLELAVNGYPVGRALAGISAGGKDWYKYLSGAEEVAFRTVLIYLSDKVGADLQETKESLGGMPIEFVPRLAVYKEAVVKALKLPDLFLVEVGGEETTLALIKNKELVHFRSFPLGSRHFFRSIGRQFNISFEAAEDLKRQYGQGLLGEPQRSRLADFMLKEVKEWEKLFREELKTFYPVGPIPSEVALTGEGAEMPEIAAIVKSSDWFGELSYVETPKIRVLAAENVFAGDTLGGSLRESQEFALASLIFYSLHHNPMF